MSEVDLQNSLIEAIQIMVTEHMNKANFTSSNVGLVKSVDETSCLIEIQGTELTCMLMEHLQSWIQVGDIVIVQDLFSDSVKKAVIGKVGSVNPDDFIIHDTIEDKIVSGVEQLYDISTEEVLNYDLEMEKNENE